MFGDGYIAFQPSGGIWWIIVLLLLFGAGLVLLYHTTDKYAGRRERTTSFALRAAALLLLFLPFFEPAWVVPDVVPDENFVAVLVDASESMNVSDGDDSLTRHDEVRRVLFERGLTDELEEHFMVRYYAFGADARREQSVRDATSDQRSTNLAAALGRVASDFRSLPLSGVVLLTDGADNSTDVPLDVAEALRETDVPLHVVGFGTESAAGDRELMQATVNPGVEFTTGAEIDVKVRTWEENPAPVAVNLYRGDRLVHTQRQALKGDGRVDYFTLYYEPEGTDALEYSLRIEPTVGEVNVRNNSAELLIDPRRDTLRVLFIEGHPRRDFKFIKRALEDDPAVQVSSILRTGTGKFYRQGIREADELAGGFPASREELFRYRAVVLGDVEATHFSMDQLRMLEEFVRVRGGGLVMLGGRATFAEGNYWNGPINDLLPIEVDPSRRTVLTPKFETTELDLPAEEKGFRFVPTREGMQSPILRLTADPEENVAAWESLPGLTSINYLGGVKPGATVLAEKPEDGFGEREPLLVVQRYGKGRSAVLATASTWRWQMLVDAEDQRHERFWRQFTRWLTASAPGRVEVALDGDRFSPDDEVTARVTVYDPEYRPESEAEITAFVSTVAGGRQPATFRPDLGGTGTYTATLLPSSEGVHTLHVEARLDDGTTFRKSHNFLVRPSNREYHDVVLKRDFLENLAAAGGGEYHAPADADAIPSKLRSRRTTTSVYHASSLWDKPPFFLLIVGLLAGEWAWRRRRRLP